MDNERDWRRLGDMCPHCGDEAEVFTKCNSGEACDDEDARCMSCRCPGCVTVDDDGDVVTASVRWHDEPGCNCDWCAMSALITKADKRRAAAEAEVERLREALEKYADRENWGYYDESGCPKGIGRDTDACFIGPEVAEAALTPPPTANEGATTLEGAGGEVRADAPSEAVEGV